MAETRRKDIVIRFLTDTTGLNKGLKEAEGTLTTFTKRVNTSSGDLSKMNTKLGASSRFFGSLKSAVGSAGNEILNLTRGIPVVGRLTEAIGNMSPQAKAAAVAIGAISLAVVGMTKAASQTETTLTNMQTILARQGVTLNETKSFYRDIMDLANETPLESPEVGEAAKRLLAVEVPMGKVKDMIRTIGDVSAGSGKNFLELVDIMAKNKTSGIIQGEDIKQLAGAGIPILSELSRMTGRTTGEIEKMGTEGKLSYDILVEAMQNMSQEGGLYGNAMQKLSGTLAGLWSTIKDNAKSIYREMSGILADEGVITYATRLKAIIKDVANGIITLVKSNKERFQTLGLIIGNLLTVFWQAGKTAYEVFKPVLSIVGAVLGLAVDVGLTITKWGSSEIIGFLRGVAKIFTTIYDVASNIGRWFYNFYDMASGVTWFLEKIKDFVASIKLGIFFTNAYIKAVFAGWSVAIDEFINKHSLIKGVIDVLTGRDTGERTPETTASEAYQNEQQYNETVKKKPQAIQAENKEAAPVQTNSTKNIYNINNVQQTQFINSDMKEKENNFYNLHGQPGY